MQGFVAAAVQIAPVPMHREANLDKVEQWVTFAAVEHGAKLVVLPETVLTGFSPGEDVDGLWTLAEPIPGPGTVRLGRLCRQLGIHLVLPVYERGESKGELYNSAVLIDDRGEVVGVYRKTHLFPTERLERGGWTSPGRRAVVVDTALAKIGMIICYDGDFPELSRVCALRGAEIIVRPSALLRSFDVWETTNKARAYDNHVYVIGANAVGSDAGGHHFFGHSMIVSPIAQVVALARGVEEVVSARLDPDPLEAVTFGSRAPQIFDHLADRNLAAYEGLLEPGHTSFPLHG